MIQIFFKNTNQKKKKLKFIQILIIKNKQLFSNLSSLSVMDYLN